MTPRTLAPLATLALLAGITSGCTTGNCLDDGPVWQQNKCPAGSAENGNSDSDSDSDSNGDSETDSASAPTEATNSGSNSNSASNSNSNSASATNTETDVTASDSNTDSLSDSNTVSDSNTDSASATDTDSASASASDTDSDSNSASDTDGGDTYCADADGDGFGDPGQCSPVDRGDDPPPGTVPNDDDCDDGDASTAPGAAPNDDPDACMTDADDDDYGDDTPSSPDAVPGSDCDDGDAATFPGAAEEENPDACMKDEDGDGWGDASVGDGVVGGLDCYDNLANFNPVDRVLFTTIDGIPGQIAEVDTATGDIDAFAQLMPPLGTWNIFSAAVSPVDGRIYAHNSAQTARRLVTFDYCDDGSEVTNLAMHGKSVCGLAFDNAGTLWGVNTTDNALVTFDVDSGEITSSVDLEFMGDQPNLATCGMAYDCVHDRILVVDGTASVIYDVDRETGVGTVVSNPMAGDWSSVGAEYDVVTDRMWVIDGALNVNDFFDVSLDGSNMSTKLPDISQAANDLTYGPACQ